VLVSLLQSMMAQIGNDKGFFVDDIYRILPRLHQVVSDIEPRLHISFNNLELLERAFIKPTIPTSPKSTRLFDPFFDDALYELLTNAEDKVPDGDRSLRIGLRDISAEIPDALEEMWCLEFANNISEEGGMASEDNFRTRLGLEPNAWREWNRGAMGPKGGLRLIAVALHAARCGELWAQPQRNDATWVFRTAMRLPIGFEGDVDVERYPT